jgi:hypothetical protein
VKFLVSRRFHIIVALWRQTLLEVLKMSIASLHGGLLVERQCSVQGVVLQLAVHILIRVLGTHLQALSRERMV